MTRHNEIRVNVFYSLKKAPVKPNNENESCRSNILESFYKNSQVPYKNTFLRFSACNTLKWKYLRGFYKFILSSLASR